MTNSDLPARTKSMSRPGNIAFRTLLILIGAVSAFVSINVAFGGLHTLGWQGATDYFAVVDRPGFLIRDSHARFFGAVFGVLGIFLLVAATNPQRFRGGLLLAFAMMFAGGLARFTQGEPGVMFGSDIALSSIVELVVAPVMFVWALRWKLTPRLDHDAPPVSTR